jgi:tetratricopeptide (TPR) repeat protein
MTEPSAVADPSAESLVAQVTDEFLERQARGEQPDIEEYASRYPGLAAVLRPTLAALRLIAGSPAPVDADGEPTAMGTLGDFRLIREIGRGGMGIVYEAMQVSLNRRVALKVLPFAATMDPRHLQRFKNEAQAAAQLHHTNIVPVHYVGCERGVHFYAMQYIEGQTLADVIAELRGHAEDVATKPQPSPSPHTDAKVAALAEQRIDSPSPSRVVPETKPIAGLSTQRPTKDPAYFRTIAELGIQAAEALDSAHQQGIVHRDIKPANLMVDATGRLWITDFGLAQVQSDTRLTITGDLVGTLRYMSPEQALAKRVVVDHRTDIYSLGATLYELLTLEPAFSGTDRNELLRQISFEEPRPPRKRNKSIPLELETIVLKALEKNPADRYATANELAEDLRRFLHDEPIRARRATLIQQARKWARRHRAVVWSAVTILAVTALMLAATLGWAARWRLEQRMAADREAELALVESKRFQEQRRLPEARWAIHRARPLETSGQLSKDIERRIRQRLTDMEMATQLEDVRLLQANVKNEHFDTAAADEGYRLAFEFYGMDVLDLDPEEAAERIQASTIPMEIAAALDCWAYARRVTREKRDSNWKHLLAVARAANPDDMANRIRDAWQRLDIKGLLELARAEQTSALSPSTVLLLADSLRVIHPQQKSFRARQEAVDLLRKSQEFHPNDFWINHRLAECPRDTEPPQLEESARFFTAALVLRPRSAGVHVNLGNVLEDLGRLHDAERHFRKAIALDERYAVPHYNLGSLLWFKKGRLEESEAEYRRAIELNPKYAEAYSNLGVILAEAGRLEEAKAECQKALELNPNDAQPHIGLGFVLEKEGRLVEAECEFRKALEFDPKCAPAHNGLGNIRVREGRLEEAKAEDRKAIELDPRNAWFHNNLGTELAKERRLEEAETEYRKAIELNPGLAPFYFGLGNVLNNQGRLDLAETQYRKAIQVDPKFAKSYSGLGNVLKNQARLAEAKEAFHKAIELDPKEAYSHNGLGDVLRKQGRLAEAQAEFREAIELHPDYPEPHEGLGNTFQDEGWLAKAEPEYRKAIQLNPKFASPHNGMGCLLIKLGRHEEAKTEFRKAIALDPEYDEPHVGLGVLLLEKGQLDDGIAEFREALRLKPDSAATHNNLGETLKRKGQFEQAIAEFREAIRINKGYTLAQSNLREAERFIELDRKLPEILSGKQQPADAAERLALAYFCQMPCKKRYLAALRFYEKAFAVGPNLTGHQPSVPRYNAACAAALAGCGQGEDADKLDVTERARLRHNALDWLQAELAAWNKVLERDRSKAAPVVREQMEHWLQDADFAGVRGPDALAKLAEAERQGWQKLWAEVRKLLQSAGEPAKKVEN